MKRLTALVLIVALLLQLHPVVFADDSDIFGHNVQPNIVILLDNSLSMSDTVPSNAYLSATTYPAIARCNASCVSGKVYQRGGSFGAATYSTYANNVASVSDPNAQAALNSTGYWGGTIGGSKVGLYLGNYLNFLYGATSGSDSKINIAHRIINDLLTNVTGVRFGVMTFWYGNHNAYEKISGTRGAAMVATVGSDITAMKTAVNGIVADFDTPLGDALYDAGQYYKGAALTNGTTFTSPIQLSCQPNFVILITDGKATSGSRTMIPQNNQSPNANNNVASDLFTQDSSSAFSGVQNVIVHTVGFGISQGETTQAVASSRRAAIDIGWPFES